MSLWVSDLNTMQVEPSEVMQGWLQTTSSITNQAQALCYQTNLQLLNERWEEREGENTFVREILIFCNEKPAWYAQTLIPRKTYECRETQFNNLHTQPISTILFRDPNITRENFIYAYLTPSSSEYQQAIQYYKSSMASEHVPTGLWARKSIFRIDGEPLSIMEIFFPSVLPPLPLTEDYSE
jgi:chorismate--pyruvate lyase